jgi:hypothetical protein
MRHLEVGADRHREIGRERESEKGGRFDGLGIGNLKRLYIYSICIMYYVYV